MLNIFMWLNFTWSSRILFHYHSSNKIDFLLELGFLFLPVYLLMYIDSVLRSISILIRTSRGKEAIDYVMCLCLYACVCVCILHRELNVEVYEADLHN